MSEQDGASPADLFGQALDEFDRRVRAVRPEQWSLATPCRDWDVRALVAHVVTEQLWAPAMLSGQTLSDVGDRFDGDVLGADPLAAWIAAADGARAAAAAPGALDATVRASFGDMPAGRYLTEMTLDAAVHAWDLARAIGADERLGPRLVEVGLAAVEPHLDLLAASGLFDPPVPVPEGSGPQVRLLGLLGRTGG